jgi:tRNA(fMet)-specific endonuclease VapC
MIYALDSNMVSYALREQYGIKEKCISILANGNTLVIPPMSYYEIMRGLEYNKATNKLNKFEQTFYTFCQFDFQLNDWLDSAEVYKHCRFTGHVIQEDDILQAGYCINHGYTLVT